MKRRYCVTVILALALAIGTVTAISADATSIAWTGIDTTSFDSRTFEYRGNIGYKHTPNDGMGSSRLDLEKHYASQCGGVCADDHYGTDCRITSGNTVYDHSFKVKILKNGVVAGSMWEVKVCNHTGGSWERNSDDFVVTGTAGSIGDTYKLRVTIRDEDEVEKDSTDATL